MYPVKKKREDAGLTQTQLANKSDVPIRNIRAYEAEASTAHKNINKAEALRVWRISQVLKCDISELFEPEGVEEDDSN